MTTVIYPGSFDPITNGHLDIIERALGLFDRVIVTVAVNSSKSPLFSTEHRVSMIREVFESNANVEVDVFSGLIVDYAQSRGAVALVRGLRAVSDFEYEFQMALMNRKLADDIATVFLMPHEQYTYLNSSIVRELARHQRDVSEFVPAAVAREMSKVFGKHAPQ